MCLYNISVDKVSKKRYVFQNCENSKMGEEPMEGFVLFVFYNAGNEIHELTTQVVHH